MQNWEAAEGTVDQVNGTARTIGGYWGGVGLPATTTQLLLVPYMALLVRTPRSFLGCCSSGSCTPCRATGRTILSSQ